MVRGEGLEPSRLRIRPSNVRVYQFHHPRLDVIKANGSGLVNVWALSQCAKIRKC